MADGGLTVNELARVYASRRPLESNGRNRVLERLARCRTPAMGGRLVACDSCGDRREVWNTCRNRHCPSCLGKESRLWVDRQVAHLLPVPYFHVVFTLPEVLRDLALCNKELLYALLMRLSAESLKQLGSDKKFLGGEMGVLSVLHTWTQTLEHHPHVHCVVPGGALQEDGSWKSSSADYLLPTRALAALFRRRFLEELESLRSKGKLRFRGRSKGLRCQSGWDAAISKLRKTAWVVYCKPPFGGPEQVLKYLARYTHRVAISNRRLVAFDGTHVTFRHRVRGESAKYTELTLPLDDFIQRFCLHILPQGFCRLRSYGFLAPAKRKEKLRKIRLSLGVAAPAGEPIRSEDSESACCRVCGVGNLYEVRELPPRRRVGLLGRRRRYPIATTGPPATTGLAALNMVRAAWPG